MNDRRAKECIIFNPETGISEDGTMHDGVYRPWINQPKKEKKMKVYVLMDSTENTGAGSILGVYSSEERAKMKLAEYVIENKNPMYDYIEIAEIEVEK